MNLIVIELILLQKKVPDISHNQGADDGWQIYDDPGGASPPERLFHQQGISESDQVQKQGAACRENQGGPDIPHRSGILEKP